MADNYRVVSQVPSVQVFSPSEVVDVEEVGFITLPSGVYAQRSVPRDSWASGGAPAWIEPLARAIEDLISGGLASSAVFVQDVDPATGLLADAMQFTVTYDAPPPALSTMSATVTVPVNWLTLDIGLGGAGGGAHGIDVPQMLRDAYDRLVATANL